MKLTRIPGTEATVKHSFSFRKSTMDQLLAYQQFYQKMTGTEVNLKDVVEQMLLDFMADDKTFQRELKQPAAASAPAAPSAKTDGGLSASAAPAQVPAAGAANVGLQD
ncbi:DUF2274 domain-containing protein [Burkholderia ambifaria]|uniref:DUF2274 domain-containing protein n=1 Tax=Burkholderia ambifaria TaxID=152480 RepID=UPI000F8105D2|nr:DUF2274 domain-containing protein [Burkholderia ambifaria]